MDAFGLLQHQAQQPLQDRRAWDTLQTARYRAQFSYPFSRRAVCDRRGAVSDKIC